MPRVPDSADRWSLGIPHHPKSLTLMAHLERIDFQHYGDYFGWKSGGDGDNGETLMFEMDSFFEAEDEREAGKDTPEVPPCD